MMQTAGMTIHKTVELSVPVEHAWETFTAGIATWWPMRTHSIGEERVIDVVLEPQAGGLLYEILDDGSRHEWADVEAFEPPKLLRLNWRVNPARHATTVEVRFAAAGDGSRVELTHSGWGDDTEGARNYDTGWDTVLAAFRSTS